MARGNVVGLNTIARWSKIGLKRVADAEWGTKICLETLILFDKIMVKSSHRSWVYSGASTGRRPSGKHMSDFCLVRFS